MKKMILLLVIATVALACQKNEQPENPTNPIEPETNYYPLTDGSFWIYHRFSVSGDTSESELNVRDSIIIIGDTILNEKTYKIFEHTIFLTNGSEIVLKNFIRDSLGYIVNSDGVVLFSSTNFTDTLYQGVKYSNDSDTTSAFLFSFSYQMKTVDEPIVVPAGVFEVINYQGTIISNENIPVENPRYNNSYYADGIGKVMSTGFYFSTDDFELHWRLVNYHIEPQ